MEGKEGFRDEYFTEKKLAKILWAALSGSVLHSTRTTDSDLCHQTSATPGPWEAKPRTRSRVWLHFDFAPGPFVKTSRWFRQRHVSRRCVLIAAFGLAWLVNCVAYLFLTVSLF